MSPLSTPALSAFALGEPHSSNSFLGRNLPSQELLALPPFLLHALHGVITRSRPSGPGEGIELLALHGALRDGDPSSLAALFDLCLGLRLLDTGDLLDFGVLSAPALPLLELGDLFVLGLMLRLLHELLLSLLLELPLELLLPELSDHPSDHLSDLLLVELDLLLGVSLPCVGVLGGEGPFGVACSWTSAVRCSSPAPLSNAPRCFPSCCWVTRDRISG